MIKIGSIVIDCDDFFVMSTFWQKALHYVPRDPPQIEPCMVLRDSAEKGPNVTIDQMQPERGKLHLDLYTDDPEGEVKRLISLGATLYRPREPGEDFTVLADPESNLFCVVDKRSP
jgi:hypothetical protein